MVFPANISKLDNGLTVIHQYLATTPVVVVDVWVRAGARLEPDKWSGMAHFLEHMIFKGTERIGPGVFDEVIENLGGVTNAATSHDYAHFFMTVAENYLDRCLPFLGSLLLEASIPDEEFWREMDVVLEEIRQVEDAPDWIGFQGLMELVYLQHPYRRSVLGSKDLLMERLPMEMRCFHRFYYQPENMAVVVVGGVEKAKALDLVGKAFSGFGKRCFDCPQNEVVSENLITEIRRREFHLPRLEQGRLMMGWIGPGVDNIRDACGLDLLSVLLAEGRSSRLVRELREDRGLVHGISGGFSLQSDSSLLTISAVLEARFCDRVEAVIGDRISELISVPISWDELGRCQRLLVNDYAFSTETPGQLAGLYGYYFTVAQPELAVAYPSLIRSFNPLDLQSLAAKYLSPYRYAVTVMRPMTIDN